MGQGLIGRTSVLAVDLSTLGIITSTGLVTSHSENLTLFDYDSIVETEFCEGRGRGHAWSWGGVHTVGFSTARIGWVDLQTARGGETGESLADVMASVSASVGIITHTVIRAAIPPSLSLLIQGSLVITHIVDRWRVTTSCDTSLNAGGDVAALWCLATVGVIGVSHHHTGAWNIVVFWTSVSACIKALLGIVTDTVLVTFVRPFLALGVSLAIVHTNIFGCG